MGLVNVGDVLSFGDDPQRWKVTTLHSDGQPHKINAWGIVPIDDNGEEITLLEVARRYRLWCEATPGVNHKKQVTFR